MSFALALLEPAAQHQPGFLLVLAQVLENRVQPADFGTQRQWPTTPSPTSRGAAAVMQGAGLAAGLAAGPAPAIQRADFESIPGGIQAVAERLLPQ